MKQFLATILFLSLSLLALSQDYNYTHYTNKDGLASNDVYAACQNNEGYIFFATTYGLCRFDGKNFTTFTVDDGLPNNDILNVIPDRKGRVWILPFTKSVCYYYKGKIHNFNNDSTLKKIIPAQLIIDIFEDADSNIVFNNIYEAILLTPNNQIKYITKKWGDKYGTVVLCRQNGYGKGLLVIKNIDSLYLYFKDSLTYKKQIENPKKYYDYTGEFTTNNEFFLFFDLPKYFLSINALKDKIRYVNTEYGTWKVESNKITNIHYLPKKKVYNTFEDTEKNIWFSTFGDGVYKLSSTVIKTFLPPIDKLHSYKEIFSIGKFNNKIIGGTENCSIIEVDNNNSNFISYLNQLPKSDSIKTHRLICINHFSNDLMFLGSESMIFKKIKGTSQLSNYHSNETIKSIATINKDFFLVCTNGYARKISAKNFEVVEVIWDKRCTKGFYFKDKYYIGTEDGLYEIDENKKTVYLGLLHPALKRLITDIKADEFGTLWIATSDAGIVAYKNGKVVAVINENSGLLSNIIKTLHPNNNILWVGTIKGVNKIDLLTNKVVAKYTSGDGLPSDIINAIYIDVDSTIWLGSPEGLTSFREKEIASTSICNLVMQKITVSNKNMAVDSNNFSLKYTDNNIQFNYAAISFRSGDDITYTYKLVGLDTNYTTTTERSLNYTTLPFGNYTLILYATNKFGVNSKTLQYSFSIATPFWKTTWFTLLIFLLVFAIMFGGIYWRYKRLQARNFEKTKLKLQAAQMEQQALQAQMNPHFIFNCLNSIQQFILAQETLKANKYLTLFSKLIRQTLDNSDKKTITLTEEIQYLQHYLVMEDLRFGDKFKYAITLGNNIDPNEIKLPAMLLQPYVENSLRHGIRQKPTFDGFLNVVFTMDEHYLICTITDNGIGRDAAQELKSNLHIEYQSKGTVLTAKRIQLINQNAIKKITVEIIDLKDQNNKAKGTEVVLKIPY